MLALLFMAQIAMAQQKQTFLEEFGQASERSNAAHIYISAGGTFLIGETIYYFTENTVASTIGGGVTMFVIGYLKEDVYDGLMKRGVKSKGDKFANGFGCVLGMMSFRIRLDVKHKNEIKRLEKDYFDNLEN